MLIERQYDMTVAEVGGSRGVTAPEEPLSLADGAALLGRLAEVAARRHAAEVEMVAVVDELRRAGVVEALEGLPLDLYLAVEHHLTAGERWMLLTAGEVLAGMPATFNLFREQRL